MGLRSTETVKIYIGPEKNEYILSKALLCHCSPFFDRAFNGSFKEGKEQKMYLEDVTMDAFEVILQWVCLGTGPMDDRAGETKSAEITRLLEYAELADRLDLLGANTFFVDRIREILKESSTYLSKGHIRSALRLPWGHGIREVFAQSTVAAYLASLRLTLLQTVETRKKNSSRETVKARPFRFETELDELEGYAADLQKAQREILRTREIKSYEGIDTACDPITGEKFYF